PLNRPDKEYGVGLSWGPTAEGANKFIQHAYLINSHNTGSSSTQEKVIAWTVSVGNLPIRVAPTAGYIVTGGYYASGQLQIKSTKDEEGNEVREYTDKRGRVILKKVQAAASTDLNNLTQWALTYYVYDDLGNLRLVLPPELSKLIHTNADAYLVTTTDLNNWAFQYKYDGRKRMIEKQVPGAGVVYMVYDNRDRLVLTQDANQRAGATNAIKYWTFTKYDELNRPIMTGIKDTTTTVQLTQLQMQAAVNAHFAKAASRWSETYVGNVAGNVHGYTNKAYPVRTGSTTTEIEPNKYLSVTYYDNYSFRSVWYGTYTYLNESLSEVVDGITYQQPAAENLRVIGQVTGTKTKVLDGGVTGGYTWLKSVTYYDDKYRVVQTVSDNYKGGTDRVTNVVDFVGKVLESKSTHIESDVTWKDRIVVSQIGNKLTRTDAGGSWNAGAVSVQQLTAGQNGWIEFIASETNTYRMIGLADTNPDGGYTSIDYAWYLLNNGTLQIYESGIQRTGIGPYASGDLFKIERTGTVVKYFQNNVLKYTSTVPSSSMLMIDASLYTSNTTISGVRSSFSTTTKITARRFEYDHAGRLLKTWHKLDTQPEILLALNEYNELGQLVDKKLHSTVSDASNAKQSVDYRYNIRGWLTSMNDASLTNTGPTNDDTGDLFGMNLAYNTTDLGLTNTPLYNGNISGMAWSNNLGLGTTKQNGYTYTYDKLNRIGSSAFKEKAAGWTAPTNSALAETGFLYDLNGNITQLQRNDRRASGWMDNMAYTYSGNKLLRVTDAGDDFLGFVDGTNTGDDYTYDANGNMITDLNKGISTAITYNYLNLPEVVTKGGNSIRYIYDATGRKLAQVTTFSGQQKQVDYAGEFQYENDALQFISHEEGRIAIANNKTIVIHSGDAVAGITAATSTLASITQNSGQTYIRATAVGTTAKQGMFPIGGTLTVQAGEQYRIRAKGYRTANNTNQVHLYIRTNSTDLNWPGAQFPKSDVNSTNESYVEQVITIPTGHTTLQAGVVWNTVTAGQQFFLNDFEITKLTTNVTPEYQYNLKDHLGNVRLSFTSKVEMEATTATLETANMNVEQSQFLRYDNAKRINASIFDRTNGSAPSTTTGYSERLNGSANEKYGLAKSLSVMPGDVINTEVYAKYVDPVTSNWTTALNTLMGQIAANTAGVVIDGASYGSSTASFPSGFIGLQNTSNTGAPRAYLNWLIFDRNYVFITGGFKQIGTTAKEGGTDVPHELLASPAITITQPGYVYIWLSNENATTVEVYFDDFKVTHTKSLVIQTDDYYPFGLTYNSYQRENGLANKFVKFQGQEHVDDLALNWDSFKWRNHQPDIGRFFNVDPLAEKYYYNSVYAFSENKVTSHIELEGLEAWDIKYDDESSRTVGGPFRNQKEAEKYADNQIIISPTPNPRITDEVNPNRCHPVYKVDKPHNGVDIVNNDSGKTDGSPVVAPVNGVVVKKGYEEGGAGYNVSIKANKDNKTHKFFHMQKGSTDHIVVGDKIARGSKIGKIGSTGIGTGAHLHYEVRGKNNKVLPPRNENPALTNGTNSANIEFEPQTKPKKYIISGQIN
ncbi:MAG: M23 family metallopeptidase, partial [Cyclobacteriaceae bacterium]